MTVLLIVRKPGERNAAVDTCKIHVLRLFPLFHMRTADDAPEILRLQFFIVIALDKKSGNRTSFFKMDVDKCILPYFVFDEFADHFLCHTRRLLFVKRAGI